LSEKSVSIRKALLRALALFQPGNGFDQAPGIIWRAQQISGLFMGQKVLDGVRDFV